MGIKDDYRGPAGKILPGLKLKLDEALNRLESLFASKGVLIAYLFGSYAAGKNTPTSDLDLAVLLPGAKTPSSEIYLELLMDIQKAVGTERFDLLLLNSASPVIQNEVICNGEVIYALSEKELANFEIKVRQKYLDTAYLRKVQNQYLKKRVKQWYSEKKAF